MPKREVLRPIFIIGMDRSGTSVISEAISLHPELGWLSNYLHRWPSFPAISFFNRFTAIPNFGWYLRGKKRQQKGGMAVLRKLLPYAGEGYLVWERLCGDKFVWDFLMGQAATEEEKLGAIKYMGAVLWWQGKKRLFAKLTGPPRIGYLTSIFPEASFIHVIRDPRAVTASLLRVSFWKEGGGYEKPWWTGLPEEDLQVWEASGKSPIALAAVQWRRVVERTWKEKEALAPERFLEIRYEDFVEEPHDVIRAAFIKNGLPDSENAHNYISRIGKTKNMNYKYKEYFRPDEIALVERVTFETAKRARYSF